MKKLLLLVLLLAGVLSAPSSLLAGELCYRITDLSGRRIPAKLTFMTPDGKGRARFDPKTRVPWWAAREGVVYTLPGDQPIPVPEGEYKVYVSHGPEWTISIEEVRIDGGEAALLEAALERVVDTRGYISGDMHLHTFTNSGHGDSTLEERIITLAAEELEWAVATDHDYLTDYRPYVRALGAEKWIQTTVGNEVTTVSMGHFNAFPLDPALRPVNSRVSDPRELFRRIRLDGASIIQVNHPRWTGSRGAYFRDMDLSPHTGDTSHPLFSLAFDSFEVLNSGPLCGWDYAPDTGTGDTPELDFSVREDWFHFLNRGLTFTAVGNSDSHDVDWVVGGYPRNYIRSSTDDPARADETELIEAVKAGRLTVSSGIFVEARMEETPPGEVAISIRVQAPPWIRADRLVVVANGEEISRVDLPPGRGRGVVRHEGVFRDRPSRDTWYVVYAVGDAAPVPVLHPHTFPLGFTNAMRADAEGDGTFTPLREHARRSVEDILLRGEPISGLERETPSFRRQALGALREMAGRRDGPPAERALAFLARLVEDRDRTVRAAAASLLALRPERDALTTLLGARDAARDVIERAALDFELARAGRFDALDDLVRLHDEECCFRRHTIRRDLLELARKTRVSEWKVSGPFPSKGWREAFATEGPEPPGKWRDATSNKRSYLNFRETLEAAENALARARMPINARTPLRTYLLCGSENPLRILVNGKEVFRQEPRREAIPASEILAVSLEEGANDLLVESVLHGPRAGWGFFLQAIDPRGDLTFGPES